MTFLTWRQCFAALTLAAMVGASLRAGITTSMFKSRCRRSRGGARQPCSLAPHDDLDRDLPGCLVDHLVAEHDRAGAILVGGLAVGVEDVPRPRSSARTRSSST